MARRLRRRYQRTRNQEDWEAYREARNYKGRLIEKTLREAYRTRVKEVTVTPNGLWKLTRRARKRGTQQYFTPPLRKPDGILEHDHRAKGQMFREAFLPPPPEVDLSDMRNYAYPDPIVLPQITPTEVGRAIKRMSPRKAPGRDGITARILQKLLPLLNPHLVQLYNACLNLQHCPKHFKQSTTVVLPKLGKKGSHQGKAVCISK